ncbi:MAG: class I SAM-dependent methyltransferase [Candidatus Thorarchaeota archaeon]
MSDLHNKQDNTQEHKKDHHHGQEDPFSNPSKTFIWIYSIRNYLRRRSYYKEIMNRLNLTGSETVLDFGSGVGSLAKRLASHLTNKGRLICLDVSPKLLDYTKKQLKKYPNVKYFLGDITKQSIPEKSVDYIVSTWVLHHLDRNTLEQAIISFKSVLKDEGKIFIIEFPENYSSNHRIHSIINLNDILDLFKAQNFSNRVLLTKKTGILYEFSN